VRACSAEHHTHATGGRFACSGGLVNAVWRCNVFVCVRVRVCLEGGVGVSQHKPAVGPKKRRDGKDGDDGEISLTDKIPS